MSLTPEYLNVDFSTLLERLKSEIDSSSVFRDYNYEGSNISVILELLSYIGELTTFYTNKLAKNSYFDTVEIYENAHRLASWMGYHPKGHISATTTLSVTATDNDDLDVGDTIYVPAWTEITSGETYDDSTIKYSTTKVNTYQVDELPYIFNVPLKQGTVTTYTGYTGDDLIDNELLLNLVDYCYDDDLDDDYPSVAVYVNDEEWSRVDDFYEEISGLQDQDDVYRLEYDKYRRYKVIFSAARNTPSDTDEIEVKVLQTLGENGDVGAGTLTTIPLNFLYNETKSTYIESDYLTCTNPSASSVGSAPETVDEIKTNAPRVLNAQYRNVTADDYVTYLEKRSDVDSAGVWGEKEVAPSGNVQEFNKVYITVIPNEWNNGTINTSAATYDETSFDVPTSWASSFENTISEYLEVRKMLCVYEYYEVPDLVYFWYDIGLKLKRTYTFANVVEDVKSKLEYYFSTTKREFGETISFIDIINYVLDPSEVSPSSDFEQIKGIQNMIIRDIECWNTNTSTTIYEPNNNNLYPQYTVADTTYTGVNKVRNITIGPDQYPMIKTSRCVFNEES